MWPYKRARSGWQMPMAWISTTASSARMGQKNLFQARGLSRSACNYCYSPATHDRRFRDRDKSCRSSTWRSAMRGLFFARTSFFETCFTRTAILGRWPHICVADSGNGGVCTYERPRIPAPSRIAERSQAWCVGFLVQSRLTAISRTH